MDRFGTKSFLTLGEADLAAYADARAADIDLVIAEPFRLDVLENLVALQGHAQRLATALQSSAAPSPSSARACPDVEVGPAEARGI
jgi:hypothetical protein